MVIKFDAEATHYRQIMWRITRFPEDALLNMVLFLPRKVFSSAEIYLGEFKYIDPVKIVKMNSALLAILGSSRALAGGLSWFAPTLGLTLFVTPEPKPETSLTLVARLFGARDLVLGVSVLYVTNPEVLRYVVQMGLVVDIFDVIGSLFIYNDMHSRAKLSLTLGASFLVGLASYILYAS